MKVKNLFPILFCMLSLFLITSCDIAELQKPNEVGKSIELRTPTIECSDCPVNYCCCSIEWLNTGTPNFNFCGVTSPNISITPCSDSGFGVNCPISGHILTIGLTGQYDYELFCAAPNSAFSVSSGATGTGRITCRYNQIGATSTDITFPGKGYVYVDGDCDVSQHCP